MDGIVDCHAHWIPPALARMLRARVSAPRILGTAEGDMLVTWLGRRPLSALTDIAQRRSVMAASGIAVQVLSLPGLFGVDCLPAEEALPLARAFNDETAALCADDPRRFTAIAALPLADPAAACLELERAYGLGLRGAIVPSDAFTSLAAAERFRPLFDLGNRVGAHFFVHPGPLTVQPEQPFPHPDADQVWQRRIVLETQARLAQAVVTLALSGFLDPYDRVTVQVANLGGTIPFLLERMQAVSGEHAAALTDRLRQRLHVDTASFGPRSIEQAVVCFGAGRVVFGSDCPIFDAGAMRTAIGDARLDDRARALLCHGNARRMLSSPA